MELSTFITEIEKHLKRPNGLIAVTQDKLKLTKAVSHNKYNFNLQDVLGLAPSIEEFVKQLPHHGFTDGAVMSFRIQRGMTTQLVGRTVLKFAAGANSAPVEPLAPETPLYQKPDAVAPTEILKPVQQIQPPMSLASPTMPQAAMGFTQVPQHEWISLKVKEERHADLLERLNKAEKSRDQAESDLRIEKERLFSLERKLETINDRHEIAMERLEKDRKGFLETEAGKEVIGLAARLPEMIHAMKPQQQLPPGAMGNPLAGASTEKQAFANEFMEWPDEIIPVLKTVAQHVINTEGFYEALQNQLNTMKNG